MRNKNIITSPTRIGLILLLAVSLTMAGARKPQEHIDATLKELSKDEVRTIVQLIPTEQLIPPIAKTTGVTKGMNRDEIIKSLNLSEIKNIQLLEKHFPKARFFKGIDYGIFSEKVPVYLWAIIGNKRIDMPNGFNQLLIENGIEVNDKNIIELAKAFVILAIGSEPAAEIYSSYKQERLSFPQITFLEGKRIKEMRQIGKKTFEIYKVRLKVKIDEDVKIWHLGQDIYAKNQFGGATVTDIKGKVIKIYHVGIYETPKRSGIDLNPNIQIETGTANSNTTVEWENTIPHYYLIVKKDDLPTNHQVVFNLSGFDSCAVNVYIRVRDSILHQTITLLRIAIDENGCGDTIWMPGMNLTGIYIVTAGYVDTLNPENTYQPATRSRELTLEKVITGRFHNSYPDTFTVYYTDQFFYDLNQSSNYPTEFAGCMKNAAIESWLLSYKVDTPVILNYVKSQ